MSERKRISPVRISIVILVALAAALLFASGLYTDFLWFDQLGFSSVLITQVVAQAGMFLAGSISLGGVVGLSLALAYRSRPIYLKFPDQGDPFGVYRQLIEQLRKVVMIGLPILLGIFGGVAAISKWDVALAWFNRTYTGEVDPQFGLDISFYLFDLPFLTALVGYLSAAVLIAGLVGTVVHIIYGNIRFNGRETKVAKAARIQIAVSVAIYLVLQGVSLWLDQYSTMTSSSGLYTGATFSDVTAKIPGFQIMALISIVVAALFLITAFIGRWRISVMGTALMVISSIVLGGLYPWIVQTFQVVPNERTLEAEYIKRNIEATRFAYGLDKVETTEYNAITSATQAD